MARLTESQREDIKNALLLGDSQYKVAQDFEVSPATVNKIFKGLDKSLIKQTERIVNDEVAIKSILATQSERFCKSFDDKVNEQLRRQNLVFNASEKLLVKATQMIDKNQTVDKINVGTGIQQIEPRELDSSDLKNLADTIDKASITLGVNQRHSNSQININNENNQAIQNNISIEDMSQKEITNAYMDIIKK